MEAWSAPCDIHSCRAAGMDLKLPRGRQEATIAHLAMGPALVVLPLLLCRNA